MAEVSVKFDERKLAQIEGVLSGIKNGVRDALVGAINDTSKQQRTWLSTQIRERVNIKKKDLDPSISIKHATKTTLSGAIRMSADKRLPLKYFGAKQTAKGIAYKIKKGGPRQKLETPKVETTTKRGKKKKVKDTSVGYFGPNIARLGNHAFKRTTRNRLPIVKLHGPSPWGVFTENKMERPAETETANVLDRNIDRRVKMLLLKAAGGI